MDGWINDGRTRTAGERRAEAALVRRSLRFLISSGFIIRLRAQFFFPGREKNKEYSASGCPTTPAPLRSAPMGAAVLSALVSEPSSLLPSRQAYFCFVCFTSSRSIFLLVFFFFPFLRLECEPSRVMEGHKFLF